ncbi:hypothetical protein ADN00_12985 [Ornatilinea apprima]|uniref:Uncharacterized protein n=1 Tax=Ornatilinea apprima TaxID=1134406 RepID=A0A0P6WZ45_9CHLR|nr:hypothetical protein [Ornatilinea apprima]KPL75300.1 hypothetical protein ADN00_12985 [Ornatilinea apprima]
MTTTLESERLRILLDAAQQNCREEILADAKAAADNKLKEISTAQWNGIAELARNPSYGIEGIQKELLDRSEKRWSNETPIPASDTGTNEDELNNFLEKLKSQSQQEIEKICLQIPLTDMQKEELIQKLYLSNLREYLLALVEYHRATA